VWRKATQVCAEVAASIIVVMVASKLLSVLFFQVTWRAEIPFSCLEPPTIHFSQVGRPDYGPYSVKLTAWRSFPWGETSSAVVGHDQSVATRSDYGVQLNVESTDIDRFECRWTEQGVTISEPSREYGVAGPEHFVPATSFLGGR
jgi:hypothetical protein